MGGVRRSGQDADTGPRFEIERNKNGNWMKITRRPLDLKSELYSKEYGIDRSTGVHLMTIVEYIDQAGGHSTRHRENLSDRTMEALRTSGFTWEHVAARIELTEQLERAMSIEAMRVEYVHRPELFFPGEMFWCQQCDDVIQGSKIARDHCKTRKHTGIYFTVDGINTLRQRVAEFKFSWLSSGRTGEDHIDGIWKWPVQNMAYCWGTQTYTGGELRAVFAVGDYRKSTYEPFPEAFEFDLDYSQKELDENWSMIANNARALEWI